jgi:hypothetical protein
MPELVAAAEADSPVSGRTEIGGTVVEVGAVVADGVVVTHGS